MSITRASKIVAVAKNYALHKIEMGGTADKLASPSIFLKPNSSIIFQGQNIIRPKAVKDLHHEVELGVIIGSKCKNIRASDWQNYVSGYCVALDMTARDHQSVAKAAGMPWTLGKCWDTFAPLGDIIPVKDIKDPHNLTLFLSIDGVEKQRGHTGDMLAKIPELLEFISGVMALDEGDVILTGTPHGIGPVTPGQTIVAGIEDPETMKIITEIVFPVVQEE